MACARPTCGPSVAVKIPSDALERDRQRAFDAQQQTKGHGVLGMRERVNLARGVLSDRVRQARHNSARSDRRGRCPRSATRRRLQLARRTRHVPHCASSAPSEALLGRTDEVWPMRAAIRPARDALPSRTSGHGWMIPERIRTHGRAFLSRATLGSRYVQQRHSILFGG